MAVSERSFYRIWQQYVPHILPMKPMSDLCWTCQTNSKLLLKAANGNIGRKTEALKKAEDHLLQATTERSFYNQKIKECKEVLAQNEVTDLLRPGHDVPDCSKEVEIVDPAINDTTMAKRLVACLLNISEAKNRHLVEEVAMAAIASNKTVSSHPNLSIKSSVLNIFSDYDYNRSVITIAASFENIADSVHDACVKAYSLIDLSHHEGGHPRLGAVDLIPLHPISADVTLEECGQVAKDLASKLAMTVPGSAFFLFGHADIPKCRGLVRRRKDVKWFDGKHGMDYHQLKQDVGATPGPRYGMTGIGSIPYVMNCNISIASKDLDFGNDIAHAIRATTEGGLPGVQSMAFHHEGNIEIACNVESIYKDDGDNVDVRDLICSFGKFYHVPSCVLQKRVHEMAGARGIEVVGSATIIGFTPETANQVATDALTSGVQEFWRTRKVRMM